MVRDVILSRLQQAQLLIKFIVSTRFVQEALGRPNEKVSQLRKFRSSYLARRLSWTNKSLDGLGALDFSESNTI